MKVYINDIPREKESEEWEEKESLRLFLDDWWELSASEFRLGFQKYPWFNVIYHSRPLLHARCSLEEVIFHVTI